MNEKRNIKVSDAARMLGKSAQFVRIGLQREILPFGYAVKTSSQWSYHISPKLLNDYIGEDEVLSDIQMGRGACEMTRNKEAERLGISEETMESMKAFFVKTSLPRILEAERREREEKEKNNKGGNGE